MNCPAHPRSSLRAEEEEEEAAVCLLGKRNKKNNEALLVSLRPRASTLVYPPLFCIIIGVKWSNYPTNV